MSDGGSPCGLRPYYQADGVTLYCGDCRDVLQSLPPAKVVLMDPPYGIGWSRGVHSARASKPHKGIQNDHDTSTRDEALRICGDVPGIVFGSFYAPAPERTKQVLVWHKPPDAGVIGSTTGYRRDAEPIFLVGPWPQRSVCWTSVLRSDVGGMGHLAASTGHPHTKPVDILRKLLSRSPAGSVVDPFCGSGSTLVAALLEGREAVGIEIDPEYCEIARQRLLKASGKTGLFADLEAAA